MSFIALILFIVVVGFLVGLAQKAPNVDATFKSVVWYVGIAAVIFAVLAAFGLIDLIMSIQVPRFGKA